MKRWLKIAIATVAISALSCTFVGCTNGNGQSWLNQLTCEHEWDDGVVTKESTCTLEGKLTKTCEKCDKTKTEKLPKANHNENPVLTTEPTCVATGEMLYECKDCGALRKEVVEATGHSPIRYLGEDATCTKNGHSDYTVCEVCNVVLKPSTIIPITSHNYGEDGLCVGCQKPKAEEVLAMYTNSSRVIENDIHLDQRTFDVYTVFRLYRPSEEDTIKANTLYIEEIGTRGGGIRFAAYNLSVEPNVSYEEFYKNFIFQHGAVSNSHEAYLEGDHQVIMEGDFAYEVHEDYIDFCFGKTIRIAGTFPMAGGPQSFGLTEAWAVESLTIGDSISDIMVLSIG